MINRLNLNEEEKNRIRGLHKDYSTIKEQKAWRKVLTTWKEGIENMDEEIVDELVSDAKEGGDTWWDTLNDLTYETPDGKKAYGLLDRNKVMEFLKSLF